MLAKRQSRCDKCQEDNGEKEEHYLRSQKENAIQKKKEEKEDEQEHEFEEEDDVQMEYHAELLELEYIEYLKKTALDPIIKITHDPDHIYYYDIKNSSMSYEEFLQQLNNLHFNNKSL